MHVEVIDINNNAPIFSQSVYVAHIAENRLPESFVHRVRFISSMLFIYGN